MRLMAVLPAREGTEMTRVEREGGAEAEVLDGVTMDIATNTTVGRKIMDDPCETTGKSTPGPPGMNAGVRNLRRAARARTTGSLGRRTPEAAIFGTAKNPLARTRWMKSPRIRELPTLVIQPDVVMG